MEWPKYVKNHEFMITIKQNFKIRPKWNIYIIIKRSEMDFFISQIRDTALSSYKQRWNIRVKDYKVRKILDNT